MKKNTLFQILYVYSYHTTFNWIKMNKQVWKNDSWMELFYTHYSVCMAFFVSWIISLQKKHMNRRWIDFVTNAFFTDKLLSILLATIFMMRNIIKYWLFILMIMIKKMYASAFPINFMLWLFGFFSHAIQVRSHDI